MGACHPHERKLAADSIRIKDSYEFGDRLGEGFFGEVRAATNRQTGVECAVKILPSTVDLLPKINREVRVWKLVGKHENCVELLDVFMGTSQCFLVMQRCSLSVLDSLETKLILVESEMLSIFRQMMLGLAHVHKCGIIHRDVKLDNFLWGGDEGKTILLGDFGLAKVQANKEPIDKTVCGTAPYMSPEMLSGLGYNQKTDAWSLGVTAYVMLFGIFPYAPHSTKRSAMKAAIKKGEPRPTFRRPKKGTYFEAMKKKPSDATRNFVALLIERQVSRRCSIEEALEPLQRALSDVSMNERFEGIVTKTMSSDIRAHEEQDPATPTPMFPVRTQAECYCEEPESPSFQLAEITFDAGSLENIESSTESTASPSSPKLEVPRRRNAALALRGSPENIESSTESTASTPSPKLEMPRRRHVNSVISNEKEGPLAPPATRSPFGEKPPLFCMTRCNSENVKIEVEPMPQLIAA